MISGKVDNGRIKDLPYRKQKDVSGLWAGKQILFTAMIGRDEFTQFSSGECSKFRQSNSLQLFHSVLCADRKKKGGGSISFLIRTSSYSELQITQAPLQVWKIVDISYLERLGLFYIVIKRPTSGTLNLVSIPRPRKT